MTGTVLPRPLELNKTTVTGRRFGFASQLRTEANSCLGQPPARTPLTVGTEVSVENSEPVMSRATCSLLLLLVLVSFVSGETRNEELAIPSLAGPRRHLIVRPVPSASDQINVKVGLQLLDADVSEVDHKVTLGGWLSLEWVDHRLAWSEGEVKDTRVSPSDIWVPDLSIYNRLPVTSDWMSSVPAVVYPSGKVLYVPPVSFTVRCQRNQTDTEDRILCPFKLGSWTHSVGELDLQLTDSEVGTSDFISNGHWVVESSSLVREEKVYPCCPEKYVSVQGEVVLKPQRS